MRYEINGVSEDIQDDNKALGVSTIRVERVVNLSIPKPEVDVTSKSVGRNELMSKVEKTHQGTGKVWNKSRPKAK